MRLPAFSTRQPVTIAMVTDYDCWHEEEEPVTVEMLIGYLTQNSDNAKTLLREAIRHLPEDLSCSCHTALANAIITAPDAIPSHTREALKPIIGKYIS